MWYMTPWSLAGKNWPLEGAWCLKFQSGKNYCPALNTEKNGNLKIRHLCTRLYGATYQKTLYDRDLLKKLTAAQLVKKLCAFYCARSFITAFTVACHPSISPARSIQPTAHPISCWRSILILFCNLRRGLPSGVFPSGLPNKRLLVTKINVFF